MNELLVLLLIAAVSNGIPMDDFFPFNGERVCLIDTDTGLVHTSNVLDCSGKTLAEVYPTECDEFRLSPNDDGSSYISATFPFFSKRFRSLYINTNGVISFTAPVPTFTPEPFPIANRYLIAPFWADVDTRGTGDIYFKETVNHTLLTRARNVIRRATHQVVGLSRFRPKWLLIATWYRVGHFDNHTDQTNTFQAVLATDGQHSFVIFNYLDDGMNWSKGDDSSVPAQVGYNFGGAELNSLTLPGSRMENITDIDIVTNLNIPGHFIFRIDDLVPQTGCSNTIEYLRPDPDTPSIIGGGVMLLTGPCFSMNVEKITCLFTDKEGDVTSFTDHRSITTKRVINGITINEQAVCPLPLFRRLGDHNVTVTLSNGTQYTGSFNVVPALFDNPDILILNQTQFGLIIEYGTAYNARWNTNELNQNDFNEIGTVSFAIENWMFQIHPVTRIPRWFPRHEIPSHTLRNWFQILQNDSDTGVFSFIHTTKPFARIQFTIGIIAVRKQTENLSILYTSTLVSFVPEILGFSSRNATNEFCRRWNSRTDEIIKADYLTNCPCTLESATMNPDLVADFTCSSTAPGCHENVNAYRCFLKSINQSHSGEQCCYDAQGIHITDNIAAGSADYFYPLHHYLSHQSSDYFPYRACCIDSNDTSFCDLYYQLRPKTNSTCQSVGTRITRYEKQSLRDTSQNAFISYNEGKICTINTSTGFIHTNSSRSGGSFELLDDVNCTEYKLSPNNDGSSGAVPISVPFSLFQNIHNRIYINTNGIISFKRPLYQPTPVPFPINDDVIAPYWTDIDISRTGNVFFRESMENEVLNRITSEIQATNPKLTEFKAHWAFIVTWENVIKNHNFTSREKPMTFQTILTTNGRHSFALFYYKHTEMLQKLNAIDDSCMRAQVGFSAGKQYSTYVTNLPDKQKALLSNFKSISRCQQQQNRIILELYRNTVDNGCNNKGSMVTDKKFIPITGGGTIKLTGPCFKSRNKKVTCQFEHTETVGRIINLNTALCPLPLFTRLGQHRLWLSEDSGNTFSFYTIINIVPIVYSKPVVMITDENTMETVNSVLVPSKMYNISIRDEPWDENYEILHMIYNSKTNIWIKSPLKLKRSFQLRLVNQERVTPTVVSVVQVVKEFNRIKVAYSSSLFTLSNHDDLKKVCQNWIKRDKPKTKRLTNFFPCPCTLKEAESDSDYEYDVMCSSQETHPFWAHKNCITKRGAYKCVLSKLTMYNGAGQQCCYDRNGTLLTNSPGRGTIHKTGVHANNYFDHFENDYFPYLVCCPQSCDEYYKRRATDDCSNYIS